MTGENLVKLRELNEELLDPQLDPDLASELFENSPDAIIIADRGGIIKLVNRQAELLFGYHRKDLIGQPVEILIPVEARKRHGEHIFAYLQEPRVRPMGLGIDLHGLTKDGREIALEINLSPLVTRHGQFVAANIRKKRK